MIVVLIVVWSIATAAIARAAFGIGYNEGWREREAEMTMPHRTRPEGRNWMRE